MGLDWQRIAENFIVSMSVASITGVVVATVTLVSTVWKLKRDVRAEWTRIRAIEKELHERSE